MKFHQLLQHFVRADLNSYAANDWEHPPGDNMLCRSDQVTVRSCRRTLSQHHVWPIPHPIYVPDPAVPTEMLCNREAMARSTRWYMCNVYALSLLPMLWRAISMISNLHIHDVIRPVQPAVGNDSSQPHSLSLQTLWRAILISYRNIHKMIRPVQPAAGYDSSQPHSLVSPDAMEGNINDIISQYTRGDTPCTTCSRLRFNSYLTPCSLQTLWRAILMKSYRNIHEVIRPVQPAAGYDSSRTSLISLSRRYGGQYQLYHIAIYTRWYALYNLQPTTIHLKPHSLFSPDAMEGNVNDIISQYTRGDTLYNLQPVTIHLEPHSFLSPDAMEANINDIISQYIHKVIRPVQPAAGYDSSQTSLPFHSRRYGGQY